MGLMSFLFTDTALDLRHSLIACFYLSTLLIILLTSVLVYQSKTAGISHIPGPWLARYTDAWGLWSAWKSGWSGDEGPSHLQQRYGNVIRTGPRTVTVMDPEAIPVIYGIRSKLDKSEAYLPFRQPGVKTSLLAIQDENMHSQYRKLVANAYTMSSAKGYEPNVDQVVGSLVEVCSRHAKNGEPMDLGLWCQLYCIDVVSKMSIGKSFGYLEGNGKDEFGLLDVLQKYTRYVSLISHMPWIHLFVTERILAIKKSKPYPFLKLFHSTIAERLEKPASMNAERPDLLSHFLSTHVKDPDMMTERQVLISTSGNLLGGSLSPGVAFRELCHFLTAQTDAQDKLHRELIEAKVTAPIPSFDETKDLAYLDGAIRECFRMHSTTSFDLQRLTGPNGLDLPDGCHVPAGIQIGSPSGMINRDRGVFGDDADQFNPERWVKGKDESIEEYEQRKNRMDRTDMTFGQGSRRCIGKNIATFEFTKAVSALMLSFKFEPIQIAGKEEIWVTVHQRDKL